MNFLGHAYLSFEQPGIVSGNLAGDFIKGTKFATVLPQSIVQGVRLHRKIDQWADEHMAAKRAAIFFKEAFGRYAAPLVDITFDHFLANDPHHFPSAEALHAFTQRIYALVQNDLQYLPENFARMFNFMQNENWLLQYRKVGFMKQAFNGLARRAQHLIEIEKAYPIFIGHYYELNQCYYELIESMDSAVKIELSKTLDQ